MMMMIDTISTHAETTTVRLAQLPPTQRRQAAPVNSTVIGGGLVLLLLTIVSAQIVASDGWTEARQQLMERGSSTPAGTPSSTQQLKELVQLAAQGPSDDQQLVDWIQMADYASHELSKCREAHFRSLVALREELMGTGLARYLSVVIKSQRKWCEDYLNQEVDRRVGQLDGQSGHFIKLFMEFDTPGRDFYLTPDASIGKLRQVAEAKLGEWHTSEQFHAHFGPALFDSCRQLIEQLDDLEPIRRDHEIFARLPLRCEHNFRVYALCKNLLHFDLLESIDQVLIHDVKMRSEIIKFGRFLPTTGSGSEHHDSEAEVREAALEYAYELELTRRSSNSNKQQSQLTRRQFNVVVSSLESLQSVCQTSVELLDNFLWLEEFAHFRAHSERTTPARTSRLNKYLRTLNACQRVASLQSLPELIKSREASRVLAKRNFSLFTRIGSLFAQLKHN